MGVFQLHDGLFVIIWGTCDFRISKYGICQIDEIFILTKNLQETLFIESTECCNWQRLVEPPWSVLLFDKLGENH